MWCECNHCKTPVVLDEAKEVEIINASQVDPKKIDDNCAILLSHCPACHNMLKHGPADATVVKVSKSSETAKRSG